MSMEDDDRLPPSPLSGDLGNQLRAAREAAGHSLATMAALTHFSKPYLGHVETGHRHRCRCCVVVSYVFCVVMAPSDVTRIYEYDFQPEGYRVHSRTS